MKKKFALLLSVMLTMGLLAGCGGGSSAPASGGGSGESAAAATEAAAPAASGDEDILYHSYHSQPYVTLDPSTEYSNGIMILGNVYETLTHYNDQTGELEPLLATEWGSDDGGLTWVFKLRDDVTFHDGSKMTAETVKKSIDRTITLGQGASFNWDPVESVEVTGDYEVTIKCQWPAPIDLVSSAGYAAYIMSENVIDKDTEWFNEGNDGGSGPYMIDTATGNNTVILKAYEDYRGGWADDQYKVVLIKESSESSVRRQLLETGEAQLSDNFSTTDLDALRQETENLYNYNASTWNNAIVFLNCQKAPCDNQDFRKALQYAFPFEDTVNGVMDGTAVESIGLVPFGMWGHSDDIFKYNCDLEKAKEYLDKSGVDVNGLTLECTYGANYPEYSGLVQIWQANLKELGISLDVRSMEWDAQWAAAQATNNEDRQDIFIMRWWPDYASPASWFDSLVKSEDSVQFNLAYINDPELDAMIEEADAAVATDRAHAEELYIEIQQKLADEAYMINMFDDSRAYIVSKSITGVYENPGYSTVVPYYNIKKAQ